MYINAYHFSHLAEDCGRQTSLCLLRQACSPHHQIFYLLLILGIQYLSRSRNMQILRRQCCLLVSPSVDLLLRVSVFVHSKKYQQIRKCCLCLLEFALFVFSDRIYPAFFSDSVRNQIAELRLSWLNANIFLTL